MFQIRFVQRLVYVPHVTEDARPSAWGEIIIGAFREQFCSPLERWRCEDYERQWGDALQRLAAGARASCFVTAVHPPEVAAFIETYAAWRRAGEYRFQQKTLFPEEEGDIDPHSPYDALGPYKAVTGEGDRIHDDWGVERTLFSHIGE